MGNAMCHDFESEKTGKDVRLGHTRNSMLIGIALSTIIVFICLANYHKRNERQTRNAIILQRIADTNPQTVCDDSALWHLFLRNSAAITDDTFLQLSRLEGLYAVDLGRTRINKKRLDLLFTNTTLYHVHYCDPMRPNEQYALHQLYADKMLANFARDPEKPIADQ